MKRPAKRLTFRFRGVYGRCERETGHFPGGIGFIAGSAVVSLKQDNGKREPWRSMNLQRRYCR
ncbi:MAG: hypothetical protein BWX87_01323 [Bacteroidetes bacterium ADurb.Bin123]|jgi:hypothetical protein|nr:MAG: hypothetical protein BWX87_01323 [Bacteroidetes bacterium ADurb.Bin123]